MKTLIVAMLLLVGCGATDGGFDGEWALVVSNSEICVGQMTLPAGRWSCGAEAGATNIADDGRAAVLTFTAPSWQTPSDAPPLTFLGYWQASVTMDPGGMTFRGTADYPGFPGSELIGKRVH